MSAKMQFKSLKAIVGEMMHSADHYQHIEWLVDMHNTDDCGRALGNFLAWEFFGSFYLYVMDYNTNMTLFDMKWLVFNSLQGCIGLETIWANEMIFCMNHVSGAGSFA